MTLLHCRDISIMGAGSHLFLIVAVLGAGRSSVALVDAGTPSRTIVSTGLQNLGNTCYLNAQLQCAYHVPRIRQLIIDPPIPDSLSGDDIAPENNEEDTSTKEMSIGLQAMQQVFREMEQKSRVEFAGPASPRVLCQSLGINIMEQQDSQEFWKLLLPELHHPKLLDLYQGAYEGYIAAVDGSKRERRREEPFLDLSLDVTRPSVLASMQEMFGAPELLSEKEGNGWRPEKGAEKVDALKGSSLRAQGLPSVLQLHLKRFQYDWQTNVMSKINDRFTFPKVLDLTTLCADIVKEEKESNIAIYDLQSVVVHVGEYGSGHYYAYVRPDIENDVWYRFNDHEVSKVSFRDVRNDAYGGEQTKMDAAGKKKKRNPLIRPRRFGSYGWGGPTSSAYLLQYTKRNEIPTLYAQDETI